MLLDLEEWQDAGREKGGRFIKHTAPCLETPSECGLHTMNAVINKEESSGR